MSRLRHAIGSSIVVAVTAMLFVAGCGKSSSDSPATLAATKPKPEQSFELIMETIKRRIEDAPSGFVTERDGGRSRMMASNKVTSQVFPPTQQGETYRAEVTVVSESRYSLQRLVEEPEESTKQDDGRNDQRSGANPLDNPGNIGAGLDILDPELVASSGGEGSARQGPNVKVESEFSRRNEKEERTFKLEYKGGRWMLLTQPDPETERAIALAFEEALGSQI
jgi:hypothetical protein